MSPAVLSVLSHAAALISALFGGLTFVEADLPGLYAYPLRVVGGIDIASFRQVDVDGDGVVDLLTGEYVAFQRNGLFPPDARIPLSLGESEAGKKSIPPHCDVWGRDLFLRSEKALRRMRWQDNAWREVLNQAITWPSEPYDDPLFSSPEWEAELGIRLRRFVYDLDGDAVPEIAVAGNDGIHIYALKDGVYAETAVLNVYPPLRVMPEDDEWLWPPQERTLRLPIRRMGCDIALNRGSVTTINRERRADGGMTVVITRYGLDAANGFALQPVPSKRETVEIDAAIPYARPCVLNGDDEMDYVAVDKEMGRGFLQGAFPIWESCVSTDGGTTFQAFRVHGFQPGMVLVDFDEDGDMDLVTEPSGLFDGGLRETVARMMTRRSFEHEVCVHLQDANGVFSKQPDVRGRFTVECEDILFQEGTMLDDCRNGGLVNLAGDFNGDGRHDVLLHDQPARLALYLNQGQGFQKKPENACAFELGQRFQAVDVDGDGCSDIVMWRGERREDTGTYETKSRVFLTREAAP